MTPPPTPPAATVASSSSATAAPVVPALGALWRQYYQLIKPTVTLLVVVTVVPALLLAAHGMPPVGVAVAALVGTFLASASAAAFNQIVEKGRDQAMVRTRRRPLPSGRVNTGAAATFAVVLGVLSFLILWRYATPLSAWIALGANVGYVVGYTLILKPRTVQNIVIGGAAGCVGPLIGWAAVTGTVGWEAWTLFAIIFLWTPPHFWALALNYKEDYARASFPMLPVVKGDRVTKNQILAYTVTLLPAVAALWAFGAAGWVYFAPSLAATLWFVWRAFGLWRETGTRLAMPVFFYSCGYLFLVFGALTVDRLIAFW